LRRQAAPITRVETNRRPFAPVSISVNFLGTPVSTSFSPAQSLVCAIHKKVDSASRPILGSSLDTAHSRLSRARPCFRRSSSPADGCEKRFLKCLWSFVPSDVKRLSVQLFDWIADGRIGTKGSWKRLMRGKPKEPEWLNRFCGQNRQCGCTTHAFSTGQDCRSRRSKHNFLWCR
jgi:hypothetical protein